MMRNNIGDPLFLSTLMITNELIYACINDIPNDSNKKRFTNADSGITSVSET